IAAHSESEAEAEAMAGAIAAIYLTRADRAALRKILPWMVRGTALLTRILRRDRRRTRTLVRTVPLIVRSTVKTVARRAARGRPVTKQSVARVMTKNVKRVLGNPHTCAAALKKNVAAARSSRRVARIRAVRG